MTYRLYPIALAATALAAPVLAQQAAPASRAEGGEGRCAPRAAPVTINDEGVRAAPITVNEEGVRAAPVTVKEEGVRAAPITVNEEGVRAAPIIVDEEGVRSASATGIATGPPRPGAEAC